MESKYILAALAALVLIGCYGDPVSEFQEYRSKNTYRGLNSKGTADELAEGEASDLQDVEFSVRGSISKREGYDPRNGKASRETYYWGMDTAPSADSDAWTETGSQSSSVSGGILTVDDSSTGDNIYFSQADSTSTDSTYETRVQGLAYDGTTYTTDGVYYYTIGQVDGGTSQKIAELAMLYDAADNQDQYKIGLRTGTDRTVIGDWSTYAWDWTIDTTYKMQVDQSGNVDVFLHDSDTASITEAYSGLPDTSGSSEVLFGSVSNTAKAKALHDYVMYDTAADDFSEESFSWVGTLESDGGTDYDFAFGTEAAWEWNATNNEYERTSDASAQSLTDADWDCDTGYGDADGENVAFCANGAEFLKYDGTNWDAMSPGGSFTPDYVEYFHNHAFGVDVDTDPSLLRHSELGDVNTWFSGGAGSLDINKGDGQELRCLGKMYDTLLAWKERSMYQVRGWDIYSFERTLVNPEVGCSSNGSVVATDVGIFWVNKKGIYRWDGSRVQYISEKIEPTWQALSLSSIENFRGVHAPEQNWVIWTVGTGSTNSKWIVYDYTLDSFTIFAIPAKAFWLDGVTVYFSDYHGKVHEFEDGTYNDQGAPIDAYWYSQWFDFGNFGRAKQFNRLYTSAKGYSANLSVTYQFNLDESDIETKTFSTTGSGCVWDTSTWGSCVWGTAGYYMDRFDFETPVGRWVRIKYHNDTVDEGFQVVDYILRYKWLGLR